MNYRFPAVVAMALSFGMCGFSMAADGDKPAAQQPAGERAAGNRPAPGPRPGVFGGFGRGMALTPGSLGEAIMTLSDLNMSPDFTLSKEQKEKIHGIREEFGKAQEKWRGEHDAELKKFQAQMSELRGAGREQNQEKRQEIMKAQVELFASAPKGEDEAKALKAVLDPEQLKKFEEKLTQRQGERREGRPAGAPAERGAANPKPESRDAK